MEEFQKYIDEINKKVMPAVGGRVFTPYGSADYIAGTLVKDTKNNAAQKTFVRLREIEGMDFEIDKNDEGNLLIRTIGGYQTYVLAQCLLSMGQALFQLSAKQGWVPGQANIEGDFNA